MRNSGRGSKPAPRAKVDITAILRDRTQVDRAIERAVREARLMHKKLGNPIAEWRDGRVVIVPPEEIELDEPDEE